MTIRLVQPADTFETFAGPAGAPVDQLNRSSERYAAIVRASAMVLWRTDLAARATAIAGWEQLTGRPEAEGLGRGYLESIHPDDRGLVDFRNRGEGDSVAAEIRVLDRDGHWRWVRGRGVLLPASHGFDAEWVGTLEDIHDQRRSLDRARYLAERDALTGLGNRRTLAAYLARLRDRQASASVLMLDVGGFKAINDLYGHQAGDRFLVRLGQMLVAAALPHSLCARMGGDEFCVVTADRGEALALCDRLNRAVGEGVTVGSLQIPIHFSAGVADADWSEPDPGSMVLRKADLAMHRAKALNRTVVVHDAAMQAESDRRDQLLRAIGPACRNDEFFLEYQPIIDTVTGRPAAYEALIRWDHPIFGRVEPSIFVRLAEQNGMIDELGRWVMAQVCRDLARVGPPVRVTLNVSVRQLADPGFADEALQIVRSHGVDPSRITLELTESFSMAALVDSDSLARLRAHGFRTVLDDFGTEYAVLSHISSDQFDGIKLGRDFVEECARSERARIVLRHIVRLCDDLGMRVVGEGVETAAERDTLAELGITLMQGYLFSRPRRAEDHRLG